MAEISPPNLTVPGEPAASRSSTPAAQSISRTAGGSPQPPVANGAMVLSEQRKRKAESVGDSQETGSGNSSPAAGISLERRAVSHPPAALQDAPNKRLKTLTPPAGSSDSTANTVEAELKAMKAELLSTKNACLKAKLDNEQNKTKLIEKDRVLTALADEYQHYKAEASAKIARYEQHLLSDGDAQLRVQLEQAHACNATLEARIQELEMKIKADRAQWDSERQQMAEMVELLEQIEQATKNNGDMHLRPQEKERHTPAVHQPPPRATKTPEAPRSQSVPGEGLSNAELDIGVEAEEEEDDPNLNAVIPVDEEALRQLEEQKKMEAMIKVEVPEEALAELKKEPSIVEDFPVTMNDVKSNLDMMHTGQRRDIMLDKKLTSPHPPNMITSATPMNDVRRMSYPQGNMFGRPPVSAMPIRGPGPMMGQVGQMSQMGQMGQFGPMGPRPNFPIPPPKMGGPMPMAPPAFPPQNGFGQSPMDPMAAYFAMMAAAFPGMPRPMMPPNVSNFPPASMDMMRQMMAGRPPAPPAPSQAEPVAPTIKSEPDVRPPPASAPAPSVAPKAAEVPVARELLVEEKETTIYKVKAALYSVDPRTRTERKECDQGTVAVKAVITRPGTGRLVMYDDWNDFKVLNVALTKSVTTKVQGYDVWVTVQVDNVTLTYIINLKTPQACEELFAAIQNVSVTNTSTNPTTKEGSLSHHDVVDFLKSAAAGSSAGGGNSSASGSTAAIAAEPDAAGGVASTSSSSSLRRADDRGAVPPLPPSSSSAPRVGYGGGGHWGGGGRTMHGGRY
ncbi:hypothetical protein HDV00_009884 [Rhizophlyctis rosea]|nr:hypothetical protein HDV00_009884 [Rhizophlyctis rosea]